MRRGFWFAAGAGAGIYASMRARRVAEAFTSDGISDRISALQLGARLLRDDIASGAAEKEIELRHRIATTAEISRTRPREIAPPSTRTHEKDPR